MPKTVGGTTISLEAPEQRVLGGSLLGRPMSPSGRRALLVAKSCVHRTLLLSRSLCSTSEGEGTQLKRGAVTSSAQTLRVGLVRGFASKTKGKRLLELKSICSIAFRGGKATCGLELIL